VTPTAASGQLSRHMTVLAGAAAPAVKVAGVVLAARRHPGYSHIGQSMSELGAVGAPGARVARCGTATNGLLQLCFAYGLFTRRRFAESATFAGIGVAALGGAWFPLAGPTGQDHPPSRWHNLFGIAGGALLMLAPLLGVVDQGAPGRYRWTSAVLASASLTSGAAAFSGMEGSRRGLWQRLFQTSSHTWQILTVVRLLTDQDFCSALIRRGPVCPPSGR
jgi:hypothetical protein